MKAQEKEEKNKMKFRYAVGLYKALQDSPLKSYRQLAKEAGMEPAHIQRISVGKLDVTLTTNVSIANALGFSYTSFSSYYDNITDKDVDEFLEYLEMQKKLRGNTKKKTRNDKSKKR